MISRKGYKSLVEQLKAAPAFGVLEENDLDFFMARFDRIEKICSGILGGPRISEGDFFNYTWEDHELDLLILFSLPEKSNDASVWHWHSCIEQAVEDLDIHIERDTSKHDDPNAIAEKLLELVGGIKESSEVRVTVVSIAWIEALSLRLLGICAEKRFFTTRGIDPSQ